MSTKTHRSPEPLEQAPAFAMHCDENSWCHRFEKISQVVSILTGHPVVFSVAAGILVVWAATGPFFHFSDTWQLVINTFTSLSTYLMVFLIQNTQNRESKALQIKLNELIRASQASNSLLDSEELSDEDLEKLRLYYKKLRDKKDPRANTATRQS